MTRALAHAQHNHMASAQQIPAQSARGILEDEPLAFNLSNGANRGKLYLVYTDYPTGGSINNTQFWLNFSTNYGATWLSLANQIRVSDETTTRNQFFPALAVDPASGNVAIAWYDCRNDAGNTNTQCFAAISRNGGTSFSANFQVCPGPSSVNFLTPFWYSIFQYGDYTGLAYLNGVMRFAWADNSNNGDPDPNRANPDGTAAMDIYTCTVKY